MNVECILSVPILLFFLFLSIIPARANEQLRPFYFNYDFATKIHDEWSREKLFDYLGKTCDMDELTRNVTGAPSFDVKLAGKAAPGSYGEWVNLNWANSDEKRPMGWHKYHHIAEEFSDEYDSIVPNKHKFVRSLRHQMTSYYYQTATAQFVLDFKPEAMDLGYFQKCYDVHRIYYYWLDRSFAIGYRYLDDETEDGAFPNWMSNEQWAEMNEAWANKKRDKPPKRLFRPR